MKIHIVKEGDTLFKLSQQYGVDMEKLTAANPQLQDPNQIDIGMKIKIPSQPKQLKSKKLLDKKTSEKEQMLSVTSEVNASSEIEEESSKAEEQSEVNEKKENENIQTEVEKEVAEMKPKDSMPKIEIKVKKEEKIEHEVTTDSSETKKQGKNQLDSLDLFKQEQIPSVKVGSLYDLPKIPGMEEETTKEEESTTIATSNNYPGIANELQPGVHAHHVDPYGSSAYVGYANPPAQPNTTNPAFVSNAWHPVTTYAVPAYSAFAYPVAAYVNTPTNMMYPYSETGLNAYMNTPAVVHAPIQPLLAEPNMYPTPSPQANTPMFQGSNLTSNCGCQERNSHLPSYNIDDANRSSPVTKEDFRMKEASKDVRVKQSKNKPVKKDKKAVKVKAVTKKKVSNKKKNDEEKKKGRNPWLNYDA